MTTELRFLLSGPGLIGTQHARLIGKRQDSMLVSVVAPPSKENDQFADEHAVPRFDDIETALMAGEIDAAVISSPNGFHFDQAMACISRGIPTLVEKPVTDDTADARTLADRAEQLNVPLLVGHHRTYSPLLEAARSFIRSDHFGRLVAVQGAALFHKPASYFIEGEWRTKIGGGPILINLIHEIGLFRYLCGEIDSVSALASQSVRHFEVEDSVAINFRFASGALGTFILSDTAASSKSWEMTSGENPAYPRFLDDNCYHFAGTRGSLDFPTMKARYYAADTEASWWDPMSTEQLHFERANPLERQLEHFIQVVKGRATPRVSARDGYRNMLVVEAIRRSISSGEAVVLTDHSGA